MTPDLIAAVVLSGTAGILIGIVAGRAMVAPAEEEARKVKRRNQSER